MDADTISLASQSLMIAGFGLAIVATIAKRYWALAAFLLLAIVESYNRFRYPFHVWVRDALLSRPGQPGAKAALQSTLLYSCAIAGCLILAILIPYLVRASHGRRLMAAGLFLIAATLGLELISPHRIDLVIYHAEGPFARSAIAYFMGAMAIAGGAVMTPRQR